MNLKTAEIYLGGYRRGKPNEPCVEKAHRLLEGDSEWRRRMEEQVAFDGQVARAVQAMEPPHGLRERVCGGESKAPSRRAQFAVPTFIAAFCGLAVIVGLLVLFELDRRAHFPGSDAVSRMVSSANAMNSLDLVPLAKQVKAGELGDWFYMRGFEAFQVAPPLDAAPAVGSRLFKQDGNSVAQVAVEWHDALLYIFRADVFGVELPSGGGWRYLQADDWQAAVRKEGNTCTVVAFRGDEKEMRDFLKAPGKP